MNIDIIEQSVKIDGEDKMEEINLKELFNIFWSKKIFIIIMITIFVFLGIGYTKFMVKPEYQSKATLVLTKSKDNGTITQTEITLNQQLVATYTELIKTSNILGQVIENLGYEDVDKTDLKERVSVKLVTSTQLIEISVKHPDPEKAKALTNEIAKVFMEKVKDIYHLENISLVDEAKIPNNPYNINHIKDVLMFIIIGVIVSFGIVFLASLFDTTIKNAEEIEKKLRLTVLASIPKYDEQTKKKGKK